MSTFLTRSASVPAAHEDVEWSPCDYAFLVEKNYSFHVSDLHMDVERSMPVWLEWAIRDKGSLSCGEAKNRSGYACIGANSECVDESVKGTGYFCKCKKGFEGNPYDEAKNGCTSNYTTLFFQVQLLPILFLGFET